MQSACASGQPCAIRSPCGVRAIIAAPTMPASAVPSSWLHSLVSLLTTAVGRGPGGRPPHPACCVSEQEFDSRLAAAVVQEHPTRDSTLTYFSELGVDSDTMQLAATSLVSCGPGSSLVRQIPGQTQCQRPKVDAALQQLPPQTRFVVLTGRSDSGYSRGTPDAVLAERRRVSCAGAQLHACPLLPPGLAATQGGRKSWAQAGGRPCRSPVGRTWCAAS